MNAFVKKLQIIFNYKITIKYLPLLFDFNKLKTVIAVIFY